MQSPVGVRCYCFRMPIRVGVVKITCYDDIAVCRDTVKRFSKSATTCVVLCIRAIVTANI